MIESKVSILTHYQLNSRFLYEKSLNVDLMSVFVKGDPRVSGSSLFKLYASLVKYMGFVFMVWGWMWRGWLNVHVYAVYCTDGIETAVNMPLCCDPTFGL